MKLIVGLGNPGTQYKKTRHNLGFMVMEALKQEFKGLDFKLNKKYHALLAGKKVKSDKIIFCLPQTFMNLSGQPVARLVRFYKIEGKNIWVIHDDVDLPLGKIRISYNSSSAGHRGVESIIQSLGHQNFVRFRIGIKPVEKLMIPTEEFVLQKFTLDEQKNLKDVTATATKAVIFAMKNGLDKAMTKFN